MGRQPAAAGRPINSVYDAPGAVRLAAGVTMGRRMAAVDHDILRVFPTGTRRTWRQGRCRRAYWRSRRDCMHRRIGISGISVRRGRWFVPNDPLIAGLRRRRRRNEILRRLRRVRVIVADRRGIRRRNRCRGTRRGRSRIVPDDIFLRGLRVARAGTRHDRQNRRGCHKKAQ